jgi:hypothetical protein
MPDVTLIGCTCRDHHQTLLAMLHTQSLCEVRNVVYFSNVAPDLSIYPIKNLTFIKIPRFNEYYDICVWYMTQFPKYIKHFAPHLLSIHWDGYPVRPEAWDDRFYDYDFIGSPFPNGEVGNNGFCFYSTKFVEGIAALKLPAKPEVCHPSDQILLRRNKEKLKSWGIKICPYDLAFKFSTETYWYRNEVAGYRYGGSFGFHGMHTLETMHGYDVKVPRHHKHRTLLPDNHNLMIAPNLYPDPDSMGFLIHPQTIYEDQPIPVK